MAQNGREDTGIGIRVEQVGGQRVAQRVEIGAWPVKANPAAIDGEVLAVALAKAPVGAAALQLREQLLLAGLAHRGGIIE